jgi:hypothetical protein
LCGRPCGQALKTAGVIANNRKQRKAAERKSRNRLSAVARFGLG